MGKKKVIAETAPASTARGAGHGLRAGGYLREIHMGQVDTRRSNQRHQMHPGL